MTKSFLNPVISISLEELERQISAMVPVVLFDDSVGTGTALKATKEGVIKLDMEFNRILYRVPVRLQVRKDIGISVAKTDCKLLMQFKTVFAFSSDWSIKTNTELQQYGWLEKPQLDLGILSVPIVKVLEGIITAKQNLICDAIDQQAKEVDLSSMLSSALNSLPNPIDVPNVGHVFWDSSEVETSLHPLVVKDGDVQLTVGLGSELKVGIGADIAKTPLQVKAPDFTKSKRKPSSLKLKTTTSITTIEKLFNQYLSGQTFDVEQFSITPSDISILCDGNRMTLKTTLSGSFSGDIILHGIPYFNPDDRTLYARDVEIELEGSGLKSKSIVMLASNMIKKKVEENLRVPVDPLVSEINKQINRYVFDKGILKAYIIEYKLANLKIATDRIDVDVDVEALISVKLDSLEANNQ